jgi:hypothetical protein
MGGAPVRTDRGYLAAAGVILVAGVAFIIWELIARGFPVGFTQPDRDQLGKAFGAVIFGLAGLALTIALFLQRR